MSKKEQAIEFNPIRFTWEGTEYTVEFNRKSAKLAEENFGVSMEKIQNGQLTILPDLFYCGLLMHHPHMKQATADSIFSKMEDKQGLLLRLVGLYQLAVGSMFEEPDEGNAICWK